MKSKYFVKVFIMVFSLFLLSCDGNQGTSGGNNQGSEQGQNGNMGTVISDYMEVKDALVNDDFEEAKEAAQELADNASDDQLKQSAQQVADSEDISAARERFSGLSQQLYNSVKEAEVDQTLYWNRCPMALNNQGANWLSEEEQIQNPYMGQEMPKCGSVEETIN